MKRTLALLFTVLLAGCSQPVVTPQSTNITTGVVNPPSTNYAPNPVARQIGETAAGVAPLIPPPYGAIVGGVGLLIGAVAGAIARSKNAQVALHQSTLQAVASGIEQSLPAIADALGSPGSPTPNSITTAQSVLNAVKMSIKASTNASGTANNLNKQLAAIGTGPTA